MTDGSSSRKGLPPLPRVVKVEESPPEIEDESSNVAEDDPNVDFTERTLEENEDDEEPLPSESQDTHQKLSRPPPPPPPPPSVEKRRKSKVSETQATEISENDSSAESAPSPPPLPPRRNKPKKEDIAASIDSKNKREGDEVDAKEAAADDIESKPTRPSRPKSKKDLKQNGSPENNSIGIRPSVIALESDDSSTSNPFDEPPAEPLTWFEKVKRSSNSPNPSSRASPVPKSDTEATETSSSSEKSRRNSRPRRRSGASEEYFVKAGVTSRPSPPMAIRRSFTEDQRSSISSSTAQGMVELGEKHSIDSTTITINPARRRSTTPQKRPMDDHTIDMDSTGLPSDYSDSEMKKSAGVVAAPSPSASSKGFINEDVAPGNEIYDKVTFSNGWFLLAVFCHIGQFVALLTVGQLVLPRLILIVLIATVTFITLLLAYVRFSVKRKRIPSDRVWKDELTPDDETDIVPPLAIGALSLAAILEGCCFALFAAMTAGRLGSLHATGFYTQDTMLQVLRLASITLLSFHRIIRPSNRCDPFRTMMELEVVALCWDALDGSTLCELIDGQVLNFPSLVSAQVLMAFWYLSVGVRMAFILCALLPPLSIVYRSILFQPLQLSSQPTVDRTMQGLRIRSTVILVMASAEFYAAGFRITLWAQGVLNSLQQDMCIKNILFLISVYNAYAMRINTIKRDWNERDLGFGFMLPTREVQLRIFRWLFVGFYLIQGVLLSAILVRVAPDSNQWITNVGSDIILSVFFLLYCSNTHRQSSSGHLSSYLMPRKSYVIFPGKWVFFVSALLLVNLYAVRIPAIYYHAQDMNPNNSGALETYDNALLIVNLSILVMGSLAMYWSVSYMLFKTEFTASPGNYNAIHDPTISMVSTSIQIEGALDILSCTTLMAIATLHLPPSINGFCVIFSLLELLNAFQSFGLQILLSAGHDDTPRDLVKWKAFLRMFRGVIDFGCFILRVVLWIQYNALSSVERSYGIDKYPADTLFTEAVHPSMWYGMSKEEWRLAVRRRT